MGDLIYQYTRPMQRTLLREQVLHWYARIGKVQWQTGMQVRHNTQLGADLSQPLVADH